MLSFKAYNYCIFYTNNSKNLFYFNLNNIFLLIITIDNIEKREEVLLKIHNLNFELIPVIIIKHSLSFLP
jgi:hypothetical protein